MTFSQFCKQFNFVPKHVTKGKRYFYNPENLPEDLDYFSIGLFLGEERRNFHPTPALIDILAEHTEKQVVVNDKAEWLFVCGRDILPDGILSSTGKENDMVIVRNEQGEVLGCGRMTRGIVKNILDRGDYLRRER